MSKQSQQPPSIPAIADFIVTMRDLWDAGQITDYQALAKLSTTLERIEQMLAPWEQLRQQTREQIGHVLAHYGETLQLPGFGTLEITTPSITRGYDRAQLDALINELSNDHADIAARIAHCRTEQMRSGSLRITREKQK